MSAFIKRKEDFECAQCGYQVMGNGYTNHCPKCLWSKHVDIQPGDRAEPCLGMMEPIGVEGSSPTYRVIHRCKKCALVRFVTSVPMDEPSTLVALAKKEKH
jgi:RNHCP domain